MHYWEEKQELIDLGACLILSSSLGRYNLYTNNCMARELINHVAFLQSRQYILVGSREKLVGRVNNAWFHSEEALFDIRFCLHFKLDRNRTKPREL